MLVAEHFIRSLIEKQGKHHIYTDGGTQYPEACNLKTYTSDLNYDKIKRLEEEFPKSINKFYYNDPGVMLVTPYTDFSGGNHESCYTGFFPLFEDKHRETT